MRAPGGSAPVPIDVVWQSRLSSPFAPPRNGIAEEPGVCQNFRAASAQNSPQTRCRGVAARFHNSDGNPQPFGGTKPERPERPPPAI